MEKIRKHLKLIIFCLIIVAILILNHIFGWSEYLSKSENLRFLSDMIRDHFALAALIYIGLTIAACVGLALPGITFAVLAGVLFGPWWGTLLCLIATTLGAIIAFLIGRFFLQDSIKPLAGRNKLLKKLLFDEADRSDVVLLAITRLVPIFPYNIQNFLYGITDISLAHYSLYTFIFMIPGVALYTIGTAGIVDAGNRWLYLGIAALLLVLVLFLGWYIKKKHLAEEIKAETGIDKLIRSPGYRSALGLPDEVQETYELLAQGEYNVNYIFTHPLTGRRLILRVNMGSQMHLEKQIEYEAHALKLLEDSGRTPRVYYVDGSKKYIDHGILVMDYLPGTYPDYRNDNDMSQVMACLADIHAQPVSAQEIVCGEPEEVPRDTTLLIAPADAAQAILDECEMMAAAYFDAPIADGTVKARLRALLDKGHALAGAPQERSGLYRCCVNTELNSTNFLLDRQNGSFARLVDWEKPLFADPAQDLGHLLAPTTTFWKTDVMYTAEEIDKWIDAYIAAAGGRFDTTGIRERTLRLIKITCLRGLTWCAMAWVQYRSEDKALINKSTAGKLDAYLSDSFLARIEELFASIVVI